MHNLAAELALFYRSMSVDVHKKTPTDLARADCGNLGVTLVPDSHYTRLARISSHALIGVSCRMPLFAVPFRNRLEVQCRIFL